MLKIIEKIEDLLVNKIIEKENANYSSPIVMIPKKDKTYRMCVNYIKLNQIWVAVFEIFFFPYSASTHSV